MTTLIRLYNWRDDYEGNLVVERWEHAGESREYPVTLITGRVLWEGQFGERLVQSQDTGRLFVTRYWQVDTHRSIVYTEPLDIPADAYAYARIIARRYGDDPAVIQAFLDAYEQACSD